MHHHLDEGCYHANSLAPALRHDDVLDGSALKASFAGKAGEETGYCILQYTVGSNRALCSLAAQGPQACTLQESAGPPSSSRGTMACVLGGGVT